MKTSILQHSAKMLAAARVNRKGGRNSNGRPVLCKNCESRQLSKKELATVLYSLRLFQSERNAKQGMVNDPYGYFAEQPALNDGQIDDLCKRLNIGE